MKRGLLVVPAYRESGRWPEFGESLVAEAERRGGLWRVQLVDDGSGADEVSALAEWIERRRAGRDWLLPVLALPRNVGKGGAVYAGWDASGAGSDWLGFCDADGSVTAAEVFRIADLLGNGADVVIGSRSVRGGTREGGGRIRPLLSRAFAATTRMCLGLDLGDTQCGLKFVRAEVFRGVRSRLGVRRYAFDAELLVRALRAGAVIAEEPVAWRHRPGGRLRPFADGARMLVDLAALGATLRLRG